MNVNFLERIWRGGNGQKCLFIAIGLMLTLCVTPLSASPASEARTQARKVMAEYRKEHPNCEVCGYKGSLVCYINVHHKIPCGVSGVGTLLAADKTNMVSLCRQCHICFGHAGDRACRVYVANFDEVINTIKKEPIK